MLNQALKGYYFKYGTFEGARENPTLISIFTKEKVEEALKDEVDILGTTVAELQNIKPTDYAVPHTDLIKALSAFILREPIYLNINDSSTVLLSDYLAQVGIKTTKGECLNCLNDETFLKSLKSLLPKFTYKVNSQVCISMGKLVHPMKLTEKEKTLILFNSLYNTIFDITKIPLDVRLKALSLIGGGPYTLDKSNKHFQFLIQSSASFGLTPVEFLKACNIPYVDILANLANLGHNLLWVNTKSVALYSPKSKNALYLNNSQYEDLYTKGYLETLDFDSEDNPYILTPNKRFLRDYFGAGVFNTTDFRKEV